MWHNQYTNIPYEDKGRTTEGADCWGLTRLIYKEQFDIDLPSFTDDYFAPDTERIAELISQYKEGWIQNTTPVAGDIILFRILGHITHIGVMINDIQFIHTRKKQNVVIDRIDHPRWKNRIVGYYSYTEDSKEQLDQAPTTFKTIHANVDPGKNIGEILKQILSENNIPVDEEDRLIILIDGKVISAITNDNFVPKEGQLIEYRLIPGKDAGSLLKIVAIIVIAVYAPELALAFTESAAGAAIVGATGIAAASLTFGATVVIGMIGGMLLNAIFPVRMPDAAKDPGTSNPQAILTGSRNQANPYSAIPIVLGQYRIIAPLAAINYMYIDFDTTWLRMLVTWGFGPVDITDVRIGAALLTDFSLYKTATVKGLSSETAADRAALYSIYGQDTFQQAPNEELVYTNSTADWREYTITQKVNQVSASIHFPEGLRGIVTEGGEAGTIFATSFVGEAQIIELDATLNPVSGATWVSGYPSGSPTNTTLSIGNEGAITTPAVYDSYDGSEYLVTAEVRAATPYFKRKDAFTVTVVFPVSSTPKYYKIRVRRTNDAGSAFQLIKDAESGKPRIFNKAILALVTGVDGTSAAITQPPNTSLALTALQIQATNNLNGTIEGINALVTSRCLDYTGTNPAVLGPWVEQATRNPASLFRYILQHPANMQRVLEADVSTKIDLLALQEWHAYCVTNNFTYDGVLTDVRSILDVLRDICATGRASPILIGGKWSIVTDKPRTVIAQHFTPHNSWGFEGTKKLSVQPHGIRVNFINSLKAYQADELLVYNDGYSATNASLFEAIQLPGVTVPSIIHKQARFHLAQAKLRPEIYTINADMEYISCTRGDLVRVSHDIPMWGTATGRIKELTNSTTIELDEPVSLSRNTEFTIRIRSAPVGTNNTVTSYTYTIAASVVDRINITTINTTTTITNTTGGVRGNLFMIGTVGKESSELIVLTIEPANNLSARITLADYSPAVYDTDYIAIPTFNSNITSVPIYARNYITKVPIVVKADIRTDESVMEASGGSYIYKMEVPYRNPYDLESNITYIEGRVCLTKDSSYSWRSYKAEPLIKSSILFSDLIEGESYSVQLRYTSGDGYTGPWSTEITNVIIIGKTNPPALVANGNTNLITALSSTNTKWTGYAAGNTNNVTYNTTATTDPLGTYTAVRVVRDATTVQGTGGAWGLIHTGTAPILNQTYTDSIYAKCATGTVNISLGISDSLSNTVTLTTTWQQFSISKKVTTLPDNRNLQFVIPANGGTCYFWGPQVTRGNTLQAYYAPTITSEVDPITIAPENDKLRITWPKNTEIDIAGYEVRDTEASWGSFNPIFVGSSNSCLVTAGAPGTSKPWYIRAFDTSKLYSTISSAKAYTVVAPGAPTSMSATYTANSTALFKWVAPVVTTFAIRNYQLTLTATGLSTITVIVDSNTWEIPVTWTSGVTLTITPIDVAGNSYVGSSNTITLGITLPDMPAVPSIVAASDVNLVIDWADTSTTNTQLTVSNYEIWETISGTDVLAWRGTVSQATLPMVGLSGTRNYKIYSIDYKGNKSAARALAYIIPVPTNVVTGVTLTSSFGNSLTDATLTISWTNVSNTFGLAGYEVSYDSTTVTTNSNTITISPLPANWAGDKTFTIKSIDLLGNKSSGTAKTVTKVIPGALTGVRADIIDNNVMLYWTPPTRTSLPLSYINVTKSYTSKITGLTVTESVGQKSGTFTTIFEREANTYTYYMSAVDTDNKSGPIFSIVAVVSQPPDFVFNGSFTTTFANQSNSVITLSNAKAEAGALVMPVDIATNFQTHFTSKSWTTPQDQINALYPIYAQPTVASGYYEEVIDFGTIFGSSQVTVSTAGVTVAGTPIAVVTVAHSVDNITWAAAVTGTVLFITNFRYVKVRVSVSQVSSDKAVYALNYLNVRLDSKLKDNVGTTACLSTDTNGTAANFGIEFVDVTSVTITPKGTTPIVPVYDYNDTIISATYSITSNVCTVTTSLPHSFVASGEKVRLAFSTGGATSAVYTIASVISTTQYTINITNANTSGNVSTYSQTMRIYLFNSTTGARVSAGATWAVRGY